uniref:Uncharacterized protein n=1 Tax=viral metagenome TaxID=1070528 RepID=A0A6C0CCB8_9ZZZZ
MEEKIENVSDNVINVPVEQKDDNPFLNISLNDLADHFVKIKILITKFFTYQYKFKNNAVCSNIIF